MKKNKLKGKVESAGVGVCVFGSVGWCCEWKGSVRKI